MTPSAIRLPFFNSLRQATAPQNAVDTAHHADSRREYANLRRECLERMLSSDACTSEYGAQALMELFPKDF
jgi:hypothetical protein